METDKNMTPATDVTDHRVPAPAQTGQSRPVAVPALIGFLVGLITSFLLFDDGPGPEWIHLGVAVAGAVMGVVLARMSRHQK